MKQCHEYMSICIYIYTYIVEWHEWHEYMYTNILYIKQARKWKVQNRTVDGQWMNPWVTNYADFTKDENKSISRKEDWWLISNVFNIDGHICIKHDASIYINKYKWRYDLNNQHIYIHNIMAAEWWSIVLCHGKTIKQIEQHVLHIKFISK